jgi:hypothetical protein
MENEVPLVLRVLRDLSDRLPSAHETDFHLKLYFRR